MSNSQDLPERYVQVFLIDVNTLYPSAPSRYASTLAHLHEEAERREEENDAAAEAIFSRPTVKKGRKFRILK